MFKPDIQCKTFWRKSHRHCRFLNYTAFCRFLCSVYCFLWAISHDWCVTAPVWGLRNTQKKKNLSFCFLCEALWHSDTKFAPLLKRWQEKLFYDQKGNGEHWKMDLKLLWKWEMGKSWPGCVRATKGTHSSKPALVSYARHVRKLFLSLAQQVFRI